MVFALSLTMLHKMRLKREEMLNNSVLALWIVFAIVVRIWNHFAAKDMLAPATGMCVVIIQKQFTILVGLVPFIFDLVIIVQFSKYLKIILHRSILKFVMMTVSRTALAAASPTAIAFSNNKHQRRINISFGFFLV